MRGLAGSSCSAVKTKKGSDVRWLISIISTLLAKIDLLKGELCGGKGCC